MYFRKFSSAFPEETPHELFNIVCPDNSSYSRHLAFLEKIREGHFHRISDESEWIPSTSALRLHWQRCCWVARLWAQACNSDVNVPDVTCHGWTISEENIKVVWDTKDNISKVASNQKMLKVGCKCTKGCANNRCRCKKAEKQCSLFCMCKNCQNKSIEGETTDQSDLESSLSDSDLSDFSDDTSSQSDHLCLDDPTEILDFPSVNDTLYELPVIDVEVPFLDQTEECSMQF